MQLPVVIRNNLISPKNVNNVSNYSLKANKAAKILQDANDYLGPPTISIDSSDATFIFRRPFNELLFIINNLDGGVLAKIANIKYIWVQHFRYFVPKYEGDLYFTTAEGYLYFIVNNDFFSIDETFMYISCLNENILFEGLKDYIRAKEYIKRAINTDSEQHLASILLDCIGDSEKSYLLKKASFNAMVFSQNFPINLVQPPVVFDMNAYRAGRIYSGDVWENLLFREQAYDPADPIYLYANTYEFFVGFTKNSRVYDPPTRRAFFSYFAFTDIKDEIRVITHLLKTFPDADTNMFVEFQDYIKPANRLFVMTRAALKAVHTDFLDYLLEKKYFDYSALIDFDLKSQKLYDYLKYKTFTALKREHNYFRFTYYPLSKEDIDSFKVLRMYEHLGRIADFEDEVRNYVENLAYGHSLAKSYSGMSKPDDITKELKNLGNGIPRTDGPDLSIKTYANIYYIRLEEYGNNREININLNIRPLDAVLYTIVQEGDFFKLENITWFWYPSIQDWNLVTSIGATTQCDLSRLPRFKEALGL